ncbi:MAG: hypothetical protein WBL40_06715 [Terrimicrobiaceae bacterium]
MRVYWLDNVEDLINAPITYFDGRNDNYESPPRMIAIGQASTPSQLAGIQKSAGGKNVPTKTLRSSKR